MQKRRKKKASWGNEGRGRPRGEGRNKKGRAGVWRRPHAPLDLLWPSERGENDKRALYSWTLMSSALKKRWNQSMAVATTICGLKEDEGKAAA